MNNKHVRRGNTQIVIKNQVILNLIQDLQRLPFRFVNNVRGRFQIKFGMTTLLNNGGFTLIELLVVILIIGILAAVALPQYQVAVMRAKFANLLSVSRIYQRAAQEYIAANGTWPTRFEDLSIDPPGSFTPAAPPSNDCVQGPDMYCCLKEQSAGYQTVGITCGTADYKLGYVLGDGYPNLHYCVAKTEDVVANRVCRTYNQTATSTNISTPTGHKTGYQRYEMLDIK